MTPPPVASVRALAARLPVQLPASARGGVAEDEEDEAPGSCLQPGPVPAVRPSAQTRRWKATLLSVSLLSV